MTPCWRVDGLRFQSETIQKNCSCFPPSPSTRVQTEIPAHELEELIFIFPPALCLLTVQLMLMHTNLLFFCGTALSTESVNNAAGDIQRIVRKQPPRLLFTGKCNKTKFVKSGYLLCQWTLTAAHRLSQYVGHIIVSTVEFQAAGDLQGAGLFW